MKNTFKLFVLLVILTVTISAQNNQSKSISKQKQKEQEVLKLNREYSEMIQRGDARGIEQVLADDYILTDESGNLFNKSQDLETYQNRQIKIDFVETVKQNVRFVAENIAIINTTVRFTGSKNDKFFDVTEQCTTIWAFRKGKWQIVSDHISFVKK